jgi:processive rubber oxygenase RoxA-like protein
VERVITMAWRAHKWPNNILPPIDTALAARGEGLYRDLCQSCHMPPVTSAAFWASDRWLPANPAGERYLDLELIPVEHIGTDPAEAEDMRRRRVMVPPSLGITTTEFGPALSEVVRLAMGRWYDDQQPPTPNEMRDEMNGHRDDRVRAPLEYKVRPLNGIWAAPPYLHNGSVPNLSALLSPVDQRPLKFYLGSREYDPVNVGYRTDTISGGFELDTSKPGNSNAGHEFTNDQGRTGVIGRLLTPDERRALIEYLKTL